MLHARLNTAHMIAAPLHALERALDSALVEASTLISAMATGRVAAKVAASVGQPAFDEVGAVFMALTSARRHAVNAHACLDETREQLRLPATNFGDESEKPDWPKKTGASPLRVAA